MTLLFQIFEQKTKHEVNKETIFAEHFVVRNFEIKKNLRPFYQEIRKSCAAR